MKIIVSGASGAFGNAAASLLMSLHPPKNLIFLSRTPEKIRSFEDKGASVRYADFDKPESLPAAMAGGDRLLLISTARVGTRVKQHRNAVNAAKEAGAAHIVYTSVLGAAEDGNPAIVKNDHRATEIIIEESGLDWTFLRDSQYAEAIAGPMVIPVLLSGAPKPDNCGQGRVAFVSRDDCVSVACHVLTQDGHARKAYDLTGPELLTIQEALNIAGELAGRRLEVQPVSDEQMYAYFDSVGAPRHASDIVPDGPIPWSSDDMVTFGQSIREGYFDKITDHVERITGEKPRALRDVMAEFKPDWPV